MDQVLPRSSPLFSSLLEKLQTSARSSGIVCRDKQLEQAFAFAWDRHATQKRLSGEPYIIHPVAVACLIADMGVDCPSLLAALLHDTVEDTEATLEDIRTQFGEDVGLLVDGVTKITRLKTSASFSQRSVENIRKMLFAMTRDIRVIFIKLADKLHNMRTLGHMDQEKQVRIAQETLDVYAPLANRLGIGWIKNELEDMALKHLDPEVYYSLKQRVEETRSQRSALLNRIIATISDQLEKSGLELEIKGRAKHFYSIYTKMKTKSKSFEDIYDLIAIRIITRNVPECYQVLGIIHGFYRPLYHRFKDYIALPKSNMYSSLHTTVIGPENRQLEIQIRTREMDILAEEGVASHLLYKIGDQTRKNAGEQLSWLQKLKNWEKSLSDPQGFMEEIREDLLQDEIYVFTPKGDVIRLAAGASPLDFAYHIHTDIGHHCIGAKVNGRMVPLKSTLRNCDMVEIMTSRNAHPSSAWLKFVKSSRAKAKIRHYIKSYLDTDKLFTEVQKQQQVHPAPRRKQSADTVSAKATVYLDGDPNLLFDFARCCNPAPGDTIVGYLSRGRGIIIHRSDCPNLPSLIQEKERIVYPSWKRREIGLKGNLSLITREDAYALAETVTIISSNNVSVSSARRTSLDNGKMRIDLEVETGSSDQWQLLLQAIADSPLVEEIVHHNLLQEE